MAGARRDGGVGGGELQFERDADGLRRSSRRPADLSAGPPAGAGPGARRGSAGRGPLTEGGPASPPPFAEPSRLLSQFSRPALTAAFS